MGGFIWFISPPETSSFGSGLNRLSVDFLKDDLHPIKGGRFLAALDNMPQDYKLPFISIEGEQKVAALITDALNGPSATTESPPPPKKNKVKYSCTTCKTNIWGKPNINVICADCDEQFVEQ